MITTQEARRNRSPHRLVGFMHKHWMVAVLSIVLIGGMLLTGCVSTNNPPTNQTSSQTSPSDTLPVQTDSETTEPEHTDSENATTEDTEPNGTMPEDTTPEGTTPENTRPEDTQPVDTKPTDTEPVDTKPTDTEPVDTKPADTEPVDTKPVDTEPVDTKPVDTEPTEILVESISLSAPKTTIAVMEQVKITATVLPENAAILTVMYNANGGQVLDDGVFFADQPGVYEITAQAMDDSGVSASITIIVEAAPVTGITITGANTVTVGKTLQLKATVSPEYATDPSVSWSITSGNNLATIDSNGLLTALAPGKVTVQAMANDGSGVKATYTVEIGTVSVSSITISGGTKVAMGGTLQLKANAKPAEATNPDVTWSITEGGSYATINQNGLLTAVAPGKVTVEVVAKDGSGVKATYTVEVTPVLVTSITISGETKVTIGNTLQLKATVKPTNATNAAVTWSITSGGSYATINQNGLLTAVAPGKVTVQVVAKDGSGIKATYTVQVQPVLVNKITISGTNTVKVDKTITLSATVKPDNATNKAVTWSISSGSSYAKISQTGVLTGVAPGKVTVKATAKDGSGISATFTVTVEQAALWDGSGTETDPFLIRNLTDLMNLQKVTNKAGYYYRQVADIDCSSVATWIVIGTDANPFRHNYDGGGYTISNLCLDGDAQALFCVVEDSHFKNMKIINAHTKDNHRTEENRTGKYPGGGEATAAIVGRGIGCSFDNCTATVNFLSSNSCTGGLIGSVMLKNEKYTLMNNCHVSGTITGSEYVGGLIGNIDTEMSDGDYQPSDTITIKNCSANVDIKVFTFCTGMPCIGGLIGKSFGVLVEKCHTTGTIDVIDGDIGGLIGDAGNYTNVTRCYSEMDIYISSDNHYGGVSAGGLIGHIYSRSDVYDCYATGDITAPYVEWSPCQDETNRNGGPWRRYYNPCGSLIGCLEVFRAYSEDEKITVYNCYATGKVNVPNICEDKRVYCHGALIGLVLDRYTVVSSNIKDTTKKDLTSWDDFKEYYIGHFGNNYNLENLRTYYEPINDYQGANTLGLRNPKYNTLPQHEYVEIITEVQLTDQSVFEGWDFQNVWIMTENGPQLR